MEGKKGIHLRSGFGIISQVPLWLLAVLGMAMLGYVFIISLTSFNGIAAPEFIGLGNYTRLKNDDLLKNVILNNTRGFVLITAGVMTFAAVIPALLVSRLKLRFGVTVLALYSLLSLSALLPSNLGYVFSGDFSGLLNTLLINKGIIEEPVIWYSEHAPAVALTAFCLICPAPTFAVAYAFARCGRKTLGAAVSLAAVPVFMVMANSYVQKLVGYPSTDYSADWLPTLIKDYFSTRFEIGFAYALVIKGIVMLAGWCFAVCAVVLAIWLIGKKWIKVSDKALGVSGWVSFAVLLLLGLTGLFPAVFMFINAFKPIENFFVYPPAVFPIRPTLKNFLDYFSMLNNSWNFNVPMNAFFGSIIYLPLYCIYLFAAVIPCAAGFALFKFGKAGDTLLLPFIFLPMLTPALTVNYNVRAVNMLSFVSGLGFPLTVYLAYLAVRMIAARFNPGSLAFGILFIVSSFCSAAVISHSFNSFAFYDMSDKSLYSLNALFAGAGTARMGIAAAGDVILLLITAASLIVPVIMLALLYRESRKFGVNEVF